MRVNPVYQIDFQNTASGKRLANTKRRVKFSFGFSNREALEQGLTGTDCRGEEHDVSVVWSLTSGKRLVLFDSEEVHFSVGNRTEGKFETCWNIQGGHIMKLIAYAAPPLFPTPGFRQFDLFLDGCSFFRMPRIYELGKSKSSSSSALVPSQPSPYYYEPSTRSLPEEDRRVRFAEPAPPALAPATTPLALMAPPVDLMEATPTTTDHLEAAPAVTPPANDEFTPISTPVEQQPSSFALASNHIMSAYASSPVAESYAPAPLALANEPYQAQAATPTYAPAQTPTYPAGPNTFGQQNTPYYQAPHEQPQYGAPQHQQYYEPQPTPAYYAPAVVSPEHSTHSSESQDFVSSADQVTSTPLTMEPLNLHEIETREQPPMSDMDRAMQTLVNFDDLTQLKETPEQIKTREKKQNKQVRSKPLPPTPQDWTLGMNACLSDIREHAQPKPTLQKEIMRTHAFDPAAVHAGMMVVYGGSTPVQGYGVGMQQAYYQQQQQAAMYSGYQQQQVMSRVY